MEYNKDDIITLNNNEKYIVVDKININNQNYLFLIYLPLLILWSSGFSASAGMAQ